MDIKNKAVLPGIKGGQARLSPHVPNLKNVKTSKIDLKIGSEFLKKYL